MASVLRDLDGSPLCDATCVQTETFNESSSSNSQLTALCRGL